MNTSVIQTCQLGKQFNRRRILIDIELSLSSGTCWAILGGNGAGKTTLLRCLSGVLRPTTGHVSWFGQSHRSLDIRRLIGTVPHEPQLYPELTVRENMIFVGRMYDIEAPMKCADRWLQRLNLDRYADRSPRTLSRGTRQRIAIACAVMHKPRFVCLDEPFTCLDREGAELLSELIDELTMTGVTVCLATHQYDQVRRLATHAVVLRNGRLSHLEVEVLGPQLVRIAA